MIIIDETTVAAETEADLRDALSGTDNYTTIYLANDMTLGQGVTIPSSKSNIVIDGTYPLDGTGTVQTYTDMNSSSNGDTINVQSSGSLVLTLQNMNILGRNYYGIVFVNDGVSGITLNYINVTYTGPQLIYNAEGYNSIIDSTITSAMLGVSPAQEIGEVCNITIGGNTTINHQSIESSNAMFWFRSGTDPIFVINENSNVVFNTASYGFYTDLHPDITIGAGASVSFYTILGMFDSSGHYANSLTVEDNASLTIEPAAGATLSYSPPMDLAGNLTVGNGANVFIQSTLSSYSPLYFESSAVISITNPQSFVLYGNEAPAIATNGHTITFNMSAEQINLWVNASSTNPGDINDTPDFKWYRYNDPVSTSYAPLSISGSGTSSSWPVNSNNFTEDELTSLPGLGNFLPGTDQVLSLGNLLTVNPITNDQSPISGTTMANADILIEYVLDETPYTDTGSADSSGYFSIVPSAIITVDTAVTVTAHTPFLTGTITKNAVDAGALTLTVPSDDLPFVMNPLSVPSMLVYGRDPIWQQLVVSDTRVNLTPWQISASIDTDMTSIVDSGHTLPGALIYVDESDQIYALGSTPMIVFTSDGTSDGDTVVTWDDSRGILLQGDDVTFFANEEYTARINWLLDIASPVEL